VAFSFVEANIRRGYVDCHQLLVDPKRCVRWRQTRRAVFHAFPALVVSRPGFSTDGKTALVYRRLYTSAERGVRGWILLARSASGEPWRIAREHASVRF
jgi:hypothetical protein